MLPDKGAKVGKLAFDRRAPGAQPTLDDLQRRLAAIEAVIRVSGGDVAITVPSNLSIAVGGNATLTVARDYVADVQSNYSLSVARDLITLVRGSSQFTCGINYILRVYGSRRTDVTMDQKAFVRGVNHMSVSGGHTHTVGGDMMLYASGQIAANKALTIKP